MIMADRNVLHSELSENAVVVVPLRDVGSLSEEHVRSELDAVLAQVQQSGAKNVVVDFAHLPYFGTAMLEVMLTIWRRVRTDEGRMAVCNASEMEREVLRISAFDSLWPMCDTREAAIESFKK